MEDHHRDHDRLRPLLLRAQKHECGHAWNHCRVWHYQQELRLDYLCRLACIWFLPLHQRLHRRQVQGPPGDVAGPAAVRREQLLFRCRRQPERNDHRHLQRSRLHQHVYPDHGCDHHPQPVFPGHGLSSMRTHPAALDTPQPAGHQDECVELLALGGSSPGRRGVRRHHGLAGHRHEQPPRGGENHHGQPDQQRRGRRCHQGPLLCRPLRRLEVVLLGSGLPGTGRCSLPVHLPARRAQGGGAARPAWHQAQGDREQEPQGQGKI